jgi:acetyl esterase/lipase
MSSGARRWLKRNHGRSGSRWLPSALLGTLLGLGCAGEASAAPPKATRDVRFATVDGTPLLLDLYPAQNGAKPIGLIVWVHGGAWRAGSRAAPGLLGLTSRGWALASVDYRLSTVARFPAQVFDIKAALRHLRAHASEYGVAGVPFVIAGSSAGGHLAALVGVSNGVRELEGSVGSDRNVSSDVQAIVSLYGASNLTSILEQSSPHGLSVRAPALDLLLGGQPVAQPALARLASPVFHVDASDPPLLLLHGDHDDQMPVQQSRELELAYQKLGLPVQLEIVPGAGHGDAVFGDAAHLEQIDQFLRARLLGPVSVQKSKRAAR